MIQTPEVRFAFKFPAEPYVTRAAMERYNEWKKWVCALCEEFFDEDISNAIGPLIANYTLTFMINGHAKETKK